MKEYNSNTATTYEDRIALIPEDSVNEIISLLGLNVDVKEQLWSDLGTVIMRFKATPTHSGATPSRAIIFGKQQIKKIDDALSALDKFQYTNISELSKENFLREKLEELSFIDTKDNRVRYSKGHGIRLAKEKSEERPSLYKFDQELYDAIDNLHIVRARIGHAITELENIKADKDSGKKDNINADEFILSICRIYKTHTNTSPHATTSGGSLSGRKVYGNIISFIQLVAQEVSYSRRLGNEALQKTVERLEKSKKYPDIWPDV